MLLSLPCKNMVGLSDTGCRLLCWKLVISPVSSYCPVGVGPGGPQRSVLRSRSGSRRRLGGFGHSLRTICADLSRRRSSVLICGVCCRPYGRFLPEPFRRRVLGPLL